MDDIIVQKPMRAKCYSTDPVSTLCVNMAVQPARLNQRCTMRLLGVWRHGERKQYAEVVCVDWAVVVVLCYTAYVRLNTK